MNSYPTSFIPSPSSSSRRLFAVATMLTRGEDEHVDEIAHGIGMSPQWLYKLAGRAEAAMMPQKTGPLPGAHRMEMIVGENAALFAENQRLRQVVEAQEDRIARMVDVDARRVRRLELVCFSNNASLRGTQEVVEAAFGQEWRPDLTGLHARMKRHGQEALRLLTSARAQVRDSLRCVMADDVYFHRHDVKVVAEPDSMAILNVGRWDGNSGLDWVVWLEEFKALELVVSDLGTDLVAATASLGVGHAADLFHESRWFDQRILSPLSTRESDHRKTAMEALERATRVVGQGRRLDPQKALTALAHADRAEEDFFTAMTAGDLIWKLYEPINPDTGLLWKKEEADAVIEKVVAGLERIDHPLGRKVLRHVRTYRDHFNAHRLFLNNLPLPIRPGSTWTSREVVDGILNLRKMRNELVNMDPWHGWERWVARSHEADELERQLQAECLDIAAATSILFHAIRHPKRSSSGVESLNSRFRVLQMVHRTVSNEMLALTAFAWNLTPRPLRDRKSPWARLGIDIGQGNRPWYDVLLDAEAVRAA